ncbi:non-homologous end joining protein Ku [Ancylobacter radicis]|uniref:Non-homologous end joining protein Ku n=1 Tax=Ancylobacter radicis TaxID=2836179 RepID=A0ABS5RAK4_9HYPH|nr:Ku protein [Ancylobacter radicis]MBS9478699.1 Ku protein [Ancylobacter radicis]
MSPRATWKGFLKLDELVCGVGLYTAVSATERVSLNMVNRKTGNRLRRRFIDPETEEAVEREDQVKGYEVASGEYIVLEPEEVAEVTPQGDKTLAIDTFLPCAQVDDLYFDKPYYVRPADDASQATFAVIREGLRRRKVVALASGVLFRRPRTVLIRAYDDGIIATTLNHDYEVRSADEIFNDIKDVKIEGEMLELARHIISTKAGTFQPDTFHDAYEAALAELVRAKIEGRPIKAPKAPKKGKVVDLMEALRQSAGMGNDAEAKAPARKSTRKTAKSGGKSAAKSPAKSGTAERGRASATTRKAS